MSNTYNQKLFSGGLRTRFHNMRFQWVAAQLAQEKAGQYSLFELGCFDCRSLKYVPQPARYLGADAGWEGGIEDARMTLHNEPWIQLLMAQTAHDLAPFAQERFDYALALETLEHIPDALLPGYLEFVASVTRKRFLVTVPVEVGPVFLMKYLTKSLFPGLESAETTSYTLAEVWHATCGRSERVKRYDHKGFDYRRLITQMENFFRIVRVEGIPLKKYPYSSFQVGIIAEPKGKI